MTTPKNEIVPLINENEVSSIVTNAFFWFMAINTIASSALNGKSNKYKIFRLKENL